MNMTIYPAAHVDLIYPEAATQPAIVPRLVILHTNGGSRTSSPAQLRAYLARLDVTLDCHLDLGFDGTMWQFLPFNVRGDANAAANRFQVPGDSTWYGAISIETQDHGYSQGSIDQDPWTPEQCAAIVDFLVYAREVLGIPTVRATSPTGPGIAAHVDFPQWSGASHSCPGKARLAQLPDLIAEAQPAPHPPGDDMATYFSVDTHPDDIYAIGPDGGVHHITGPEGAVLEAVTPGWAQGRKVISLTPDVDAVLPR